MGQPPATMRKGDIQLLYEYEHWANNRVLQTVSALPLSISRVIWGGSFGSVEGAVP